LNEAKPILVSGLMYSGKTALCMALSVIFREEGLKTGYFKPVGWAVGSDRQDEDAVLMKSVLDINYPIEIIVPIMLNPYYLTDFSKGKMGDAAERIEKAYHILSRDLDVIFIESGHTPVAFYTGNLSAFHLAEKFNAQVLITAPFGNDLVLDDTLAQAEMFKLTGSEVMGVIFNNVPLILLEKVKGIVKPIAENVSLRVWGIIEEDKRLTSPTVAEINSVLEGTILEEGDMTRIVEDVLVGAMTTESALKYFRRSVNKAVITGGDRSDITLPALETDTAVLILTGNLYPDIRVLSKAREKGVTVILVPYDTYTTIRKLESIGGRIKPGDDKKIELAISKVKREVDWKGILNAIMED